MGTLPSQAASDPGEVAEQPRQLTEVGGNQEVLQRRNENH